jgi:hypothetical protein
VTILCFEAHRPDGRVWAIRHRGKWTRAARVIVNAPTYTEYRGKDARQPKAFLRFSVPVKIARADGALIVRAA